jgi:hypothetical protein
LRDGERPAGREYHEPHDRDRATDSAGREVNRRHGDAQLAAGLICKIAIQPGAEDVAKQAEGDRLRLLGCGHMENFANTGSPKVTSVMSKSK